MQQKQIEKLLQKHGLICQTFAFDTLPEPLQARINTACDFNFSTCYLSLIANAGNTFWSSMKSADRKIEHGMKNPVDEFSISIANELLNLADLKNDASILYPGRYAVPLIALGEHAGWSTPSPLGLGLHSEYGPWMAYRALIKTSSPLQEITVKKIPQANTSACLTCASTPCVSACPANAVNLNSRFAIDLCARFRTQTDTTCADRCHARNACPVGKQYRYSEEQLAYHMTHALDAVVKWSDR